jgi:hypothetical protein
MPISTLTAVPGIPEGSEATPGLWNSRFSILAGNSEELNQKAIGLLSGFVLGGSGSPESVQTANPGLLFAQSDATADQHPIWVKFVGSGTTGWRGFGGFQGTGTDSYQLGRGASASGENASAIARTAIASASAAQAWGYQAAATQPSAIAWGPNSRSSAANAIAGGLNTYAGQLNSGAIGSAVTSNATGGWGYGTGTQVSHQSSLVFSATGGSSRTDHEFFVDFPLSAFSGVLSASTISALGATLLSTLSMTGNAALSTASVATMQVSSLLTVATQIVVNQGPNDGEILTLKSSDVAHGMTTRTDTDTYGEFQKQTAAAGGLKISGHSESGTARAIELSAEAGTGDTTKSTAASGALYVNANKANGTGLQVLGSTENIAVLANGGSAQFIFQADGTSYENVGTAWVNFDTHDDVALLNQLSAYVTRLNDPLRESFAAWLTASRDELERLQLVAFDETGNPFVNTSRLAMLHTGALRQLGRHLQRLESQLAQLTLLLPAPARASS